MPKPWCGTMRLLMCLQKATIRVPCHWLRSHEPPSYRSAAFGVVESDGRSTIELVQSHRALGAPLLFVIDRDDVTVWQVRSEGPPRAIEKVKVGQLTDLFERNRADWHPDAIHRAKAVGSPQPAISLTSST
ncbi:hypothetical protein HGG75_17615 [Ochrobactrum pseudogrignonense]|nr:hypothetical protein [Brucella pseudogrignonensis]